MGDRIESFEQMRSWQDSTDFAVLIYHLTSRFPKSEQFGITNQLRRAAASVPANIAEGFGRKSHKEKSQFYHIAYGSLLEVKSFLYLSQKLDYIEEATLSNSLDKVTSLQKMIKASLRALK